jgi:hypothetical protein
MLAVQTRNPGRGYPPPGPWPHWNDLAGESSGMVFEIHSKLANKRQEMVPFHTERLRDAGLAPVQAAIVAPDAAQANTDVPQAAPQAKAAPQVPAHIVQGRIMRDWPEAELGFDETGGVPMSSAAGYETPSEDDGGGYMSADDWRLALNVARQASKGGMLWPANPNTKDSGARSSNWTRPRQSIGASLSNIAGNIKRGTEHTLELVDGATSLAASGIGAAATVAQTGAAGAHAVADVTNMIGDILGGAPRPRYRPQRAIGAGGGNPGDDSPPEEPSLLSIEDGRASESDTENLPRPALPITGSPIAVERPEFLRRSSHRGTRPTYPGAPSRTTGPGLGTRWVNHRGPGA